MCITASRVRQAPLSLIRTAKQRILADPLAGVCLLRNAESWLQTTCGYMPCHKASTDNPRSMIKQLLLALLWSMSKLKLAELYIWGCLVALTKICVAALTGASALTVLSLPHVVRRWCLE